MTTAHEPSTRITLADLERMIAKPNHKAQARRIPRLPLPRLDAEGRVLYFAYGSNMDPAQMKRRCPAARALYPAVIKGWRIDFCGWSTRWAGGVATILEDAEGSVEGTIWSLTGDCVHALDLHEGAPAVYAREELTVTEDDGRARLCITYVHRSPVYRARPGKGYFGQILRSYEREGFDPAPLRLAKSTAPRRQPPATVASVAARHEPPARVPALEDNMCTDTHPHLVFVYGSLMHGFSNHDRLVRSGAQFIGEDGTAHAFTMLSLGAFPGVLENGETAISGELYRVDDETLLDLDRLEGAPNLYVRKRIVTEAGLHAWMYMLQPAANRSYPVVSGGSWREHTETTHSRAS